MKPLVIIDEADDRESASDGISRFGAYVRQRAHLFVDDWEPLSPVSFAVTVWSVATSPVMSPPYARLGADVWGISCHHGDEPGVLVVDVEVRLPWPIELRDDETMRGWADWARARRRDNDGVQLLDPVQDRVAALFSAHLRVPIHEDLLPLPCRFGALDVVIAKRAVAVVSDQINAIAGPVVAQLRELDSVGGRR